MRLVRFVSPGCISFEIFTRYVAQGHWYKNFGAKYPLKTLADKMQLKPFVFLNRNFLGGLRSTKGDIT